MPLPTRRTFLKWLGLGVGAAAVGVLPESESPTGLEFNPLSQRYTGWDEKGRPFEVDAQHMHSGLTLEKLRAGKALMMENRVRGPFTVIADRETIERLGSNQLFRWVESKGM